MILTKVECLVIDRRRRGYSKPDEADRHHVSLWEYRKWENGDIPSYVEIPSVEPLARHEELWLARIRFGATQTKFAKILKISRFYLREMEMGRAPLTRLEEYWT